MKKLLILLVFISICCGAQTLQQSYYSQLHVRELTGHNDGKDVEKYLASVGLDKGYPWCAAFVKWNLLNCGYIQAKAINGMALSCHRPGHLVYFHHDFSMDPQPGDVLTLYFNSLGRIGHTGFFDKKINSSIYQSVEGNTNEAGSREGDGVYKKYRSFHATYSISRWTN